MAAPAASQPEPAATAEPAAEDDKDMTDVQLPLEQQEEQAAAAEPEVWGALLPRPAAKCC